MCSFWKHQLSIWLIISQNTELSDPRTRNSTASHIPRSAPHFTTALLPTLRCLAPTTRTSTPHKRTPAAHPNPSTTTSHSHHTPPSHAAKMKRNIVIFLIVLVLFILIALIAYVIYYLQTRMAVGAGTESETTMSEA
ncbi:hypothetical protein BU26DRAFT_550466 [Trematosphaeria pertusa]|uniref:Uncharacterized protein n=1 Tax=Trematosphaeria pertusa TaxID=390896 RepID=A0A6A6II80_9PLEO|nr:uncharacterized protein BU26DRAFT_550466 [Trematosphaeria pertusa]KAF2250284.1 hypothetical protein BU26DRAFT_550466 [Trematosphaeria pertusa]